jgi:hypothetical protein
MGDRKGATMTNNSGGQGHSKREPTIIAAWIGGVLGVIGIVAGAVLSHAMGGATQSGQSATTATAPKPSHSRVTTAPAPSSPPPNQSSSGPSSSPTFTSGASGSFTTPTAGADINVGNLSASGTVRNLPPGYRLDLFLKFADLSVYYAAGDPNTTVTIAGSKWSGRIGVGSHAPTTIYIYLVELSPASVRLMNSEVSYQNNGFPSITALGTILARVQLNLS